MNACMAGPTIRVLSIACRAVVVGLLGLCVCGKAMAAEAFSVTAPGGPIPDDGIFVGSLTFSAELFELRNLELDITGLTHPRLADLQIYLADPFGTTIEVMRYFGVTTASGMTLTFSDFASSVPFTFASATYLPYGLFERSDRGFGTWHCTSSGTDAWVLLIADKVAGNTGSFTSFTIRGVHSACEGVCESTGFEPNEPSGCGWELGWICGSIFTKCSGPPIAQSCTGDPAMDLDCCVNNPNPLNGWYVSSTNQHCNQPHISSANPATGVQHLRLERAATGGNPPGCSGFGSACRVNALTPTASASVPHGPVTVEMDVAWSGAAFDPAFNGSLTYFTLDDSVFDSISLYLYWHYYGLWFVYDYAISDFAFAGYVSGEDAYDHFRIDLDPCAGTITYTASGRFQPRKYVTNVLGGAEKISRAVFAFNNVRGYFDVDNYSVTRGPSCSRECGNGVIEAGEGCEPGVLGDCPLGRCIQPDELGECTCRRICTAAEPCFLENGDNGAFLAPFDAAYGGIWHYDGGSPAVEFDTCGSTGLGSFIRVFASTTQVAQNRSCCAPSHPNCGSSGEGSTSNASCYNPTGLSGHDCTCAINTDPYGLDLQLLPTAPAGASVMIHVGRKAECGGAMLGS